MTCTLTRHQGARLGVIYVPSDLKCFLIWEEVLWLVLAFRREEEELKPSCSSSALEEDEGFGDWSHRMENRGEQEVSEEWRRGALTAPSLEQKAEPGEEESQEASQSSPEVKTPFVAMFCHQ